ncbi:MAG TPA: metal-dependent hydrolase [Sphingomicrobium sp.]|nr:metal-dependent hydrolase [Sphingomicrobium sp.]
MDNITHTLAGALLAEMGLRRRSRFAFAACLLGANAPDIDVFAPLAFPVDGIEFHRGPLHAVFAWPFLAAAIVAILWLADRWKPRAPDTLPFRTGPLFVAALLAVLTHPFLDWLTTYAIALLAPFSWKWSSGDAIFIVDWVYWLLMISGIGWSAFRWRRDKPNPGRPAQVAALLMFAYIAFNLGESTRVEHATADVLRSRGIQPALVVASPPPLAFWQRSVMWRSADRFGSGSFDFRHGLVVDAASHPLGLDNPRLARARASSRHVRAFLVWSRMPIVVTVDGGAYLTDQRFYSVAPSPFAARMRRMIKRSAFLIPLDNGGPSS